MKKFFFAAMFVLTNCITYAQGPQGRAVNLAPGSNGLGNNGYGTNNLMNFVKGDWVKNSTKDNSFIGTNYLFTNWSNRAEIYDLNGKGYKLSNCNFNIANNTIEAMLSDNRIEQKVEDRAYAFNSRDISKVRIDNKYFVNKKTEENQNSLLEVIQEGSYISLYKMYTTKIILASYNPMTQKKMGKDKIEINSSYFVEKDGELNKIKLKKSAILKLMANKKEEIKSFIKENKLSVSDEADLFKVFYYYNSI